MDKREVVISFYIKQVPGFAERPGKGGCKNKRLETGAADEEDKSNFG